MIHHPAFLYTYYGLVASTDPVWLQGEFENITGLFDRVGIWTKIGNTIGMLCCTYRMVRTHSEAAYKRRMIVEGITYRARKSLRVQCPYCGAEMEAGLLAFHQQIKHRFDMGAVGGEK